MPFPGIFNFTVGILRLDKVRNRGSLSELYQCAPGYEHDKLCTINYARLNYQKFFESVILIFSSSNISLNHSFFSLANSSGQILLILNWWLIVLLIWPRTEFKLLIEFLCRKVFRWFFDRFYEMENFILRVYKIYF